ncbi:YlbL family protein [Microbispora hainanensis]|uniref:endopeptidase La n=1 Tax=Microbispora hainanensis TaxID=568844 RepID=A0A544YSE3_9ACTN|nr:PDZ domain-containing protein [Microbispora hainanensis]TQS19685.1 PDZ domain-containing protein [Microbispora hainanensis]
MSRRALTLLVAGFLALALAVIGAMLPVPYVVLSPGPTENTIGDVKGKPVITISGHETYPTQGRLSLVTVAYQGGPDNRLDLITALRGWLDPTVAVVPEETLFPKSTSAEQVQEQNTQEMTDSQQSATAAALNALKIPTEKVITVAGTDKGTPADGKLKPGDEITAVDGKTVGELSSVASSVQSRKPGEQVTFTVKRSGASTQVQVGTVAGDDGKAKVGVQMRSGYRFPFKVDISVGEVGGPSAGLMFSLGIYDKLTPGALTGGMSVAGTGTIDPAGQVGPIGGIEQKMVGARRAGATVFLTPAGNCADAVKAAPAGLRLVRVETLDGAIKAIDALRDHKGEVPACPAG